MDEIMRFMQEEELAGEASTLPPAPCPHPEDAEATVGRDLLDRLRDPKVLLAIARLLRK